MRFALIFLPIFLQKQINCYESESTEVNHIEIIPYYDTVIFSDVIDIINELNKNPQFNALANSDSESDENVDDLLAEYQHYLEKAHEQRRIYLEKSNKTKNKVPLVRHDAFVKANPRPAIERINNDYSNINNYYNPGTFKYSPLAFSSPLDFFIPMNPPFAYNLNKPEHETVVARKLFDDEVLRPNVDKSAGEKKPYNLQSLIQKPSMNEPVKTPCICSPSTIPCKCHCKQCVLPLNSNKPDMQVQNAETNRRSFSQNTLAGDPRVQEHLMDDMNSNANTLNVKIKVDIQLPKFLNGKQINHDSAVEYDDNSKELTSNIRLPTTSFNFPIPIDMFGYRRNPKINRHDQFRKITIHRKKKLRSNNNNNKKHRKKLITFHNVKLSQNHTLKPIVKDDYNVGSKNQLTEHFNETMQTNITRNITASTVDADYTTTRSDLNNNTQFEEGIFFMVNISNNNENNADSPKTGNSIELDFKAKPNITTASIVRNKRDLHVTPINKIANSNKPVKQKLKKKQISTKDQKHDKEITTPEKGWFSDAELLYWPITPNTIQNNVSVIKPQNITDIILEREHKKTKLNITSDTIRHNRTKALEQAVFGKVDWNDMDAVAPTFLSFAGKYINGVISFCSANICHSMKCFMKTCIHRTCLPRDRFHHIGHCSGSNKTDSVASMESIMDLPSNVAFEIVDILQDKMLGKLHGKITLCISFKCITFAASKKKFIKFKCISKNLNDMGHCISNKKSLNQA